MFGFSDMIQAQSEGYEAPDSLMAWVAVKTESYTVLSPSTYEQIVLEILAKYDITETRLKEILDNEVQSSELNEEETAAVAEISSSVFLLKNSTLNQLCAKNKISPSTYHIISTRMSEDAAFNAVVALYMKKYLEAK